MLGAANFQWFCCHHCHIVHDKFGLLRWSQHTQIAGEYLHMKINYLEGAFRCAWSIYCKTSRLKRNFMFLCDLLWGQRSESSKISVWNEMLIYKKLSLTSLMLISLYTGNFCTYYLIGFLMVAEWTVINGNDIFHKWTFWTWVSFLETCFVL